MADAVVCAKREAAAYAWTHVPKACWPDTGGGGNRVRATAAGGLQRDCDVCVDVAHVAQTRCTHDCDVWTTAMRGRRDVRTRRATATYAVPPLLQCTPTSHNLRLYNCDTITSTILFLRPTIQFCGNATAIRAALRYLRSRSAQLASSTNRIVDDLVFARAGGWERNPSARSAASLGGAGRRASSGDVFAHSLHGSAGVK